MGGAGLVIIFSTANRGPWKQVQKYKADSVGSEDMNDPGTLQSPVRWCTCLSLLFQGVLQCTCSNNNIGHACIVYLASS